MCMFKLECKTLKYERGRENNYIPPTVGGASNVSLTRSRKSSSTSHVSLTIDEDSRASFWTAVKTCWHSLMWFRLCCSGLAGDAENFSEKAHK